MNCEIIKQQIETLESKWDLTNEEIKLLENLKKQYNSFCNERQSDVESDIDSDISLSENSNTWLFSKLTSFFENLFSSKDDKENQKVDDYWFTESDENYDSDFDTSDSDGWGDCSWD